MRYVILPQTFQRVLPPLTNEAVALLKDSSLVSVVVLLYLLMPLPLTAIVRRLESRPMN